ncbi:hypothetical protein PM082_012548 [Marasmius tenuissimus]|nr:hypothetical protein PM082_012548 [Marasmius tenuissimus]
MLLWLMILYSFFLTLIILPVWAVSIDGIAIGTVTVTQPFTVAWSPQSTPSPSLAFYKIDIDDLKQKILIRGTINGLGDLTQDNKNFTPLNIGQFDIVANVFFDSNSGTVPTPGISLVPKGLGTTGILSIPTQVETFTSPIPTSTGINPSEDSNNGPSTGTIIGGSIGAIAFLAGIVLLLLWRRYRGRKSQNVESPPVEEDMPSAGPSYHLFGEPTPITGPTSSVSPQAPQSRRTASTRVLSGDMREQDRETEISTLIAQIEYLKTQLKVERERSPESPPVDRQQLFIHNQDSPPQPQSHTPPVLVPLRLDSPPPQSETQTPPILAPLRFNDPTPTGTPPPRYSRSGVARQLGRSHRSIDNALLTMSREEIREQFDSIVQRLERIEAEQAPPGYFSTRTSQR